MVVTGVIRGETIERVSVEGATYEEARAQLASKVPAGTRLIALYADRD